MSEKRSIQYVVNNALCTACGACSGICPTNAIQMRWNTAGYLVAEVDQDKCNTCGLCCKVCPSVAANQIVVDGCDPFHGVCLDAYIGHSLDSEIRQKSQSGGVVTSLLCYLLEKRLVEGAVVNRFCKQTKRPEVVCVNTKEELLNAAGSYYSQSSVVKTILDYQDRKVAAVVLGCQAESIKLVRKARQGIAAPEYTIGLVCAGQYSGHHIDDLVSLTGTDHHKVNRFRFRDKNAGGWPGDVKVYTADQEYVLDKKYRHRLKPVYEAYRCLLCFDQMNIHSDIVVGDPWGIDNKENKRGNSVIITRTPKGQFLIDRAVEHGYIDVSQLPVEDVLKGQTVDGRLKTQFFTAISFCNKKGYLLPVTESDFKGISHIAPTEKQFHIINERLQYTLQTYLGCKTDQISKLRAMRKIKVKRSQISDQLIKDFKRLVISCLRILHLR